VPKRNDFLRPYREARDIALQFHVSDPASSVWSATHGWIRPERAFPNPRDLEIALDNRTPVALVDEPAVLTISARAPDHMSGWATVVVDFGDGRRSSPLGFVDTRTFHHTYVRPGVYKASTIVSVPGVGEVRRETEVKAIPPDLIGPYGVGRIQGLPNDVMRLPVSISLDRVTFRESAVYLECSRASRVDASSQYWVWLVGYERGALRARLHVAQPSPNADDSRRFSLSIAPGSPPDAGKHATILVGVVPAPGGGAKSRSLDLSFRWPGSELLAGSPVVVAAGPLE
jgi:hypothetical protein